MKVGDSLRESRLFQLPIYCTHAERIASLAERVTYFRDKAMMRYFFLPLGYAWALPNTLLGACFLPLALLSGGGVRFERGAMEIHGGFTKWFLRRVARGASAMTLGHVILGQNRDCLDWTRNHEHVHVGQYVRWGPFFLPAYALSSFLCWCRGQNPYFDNRFEKPAFEQFP